VASVSSQATKLRGRVVSAVLAMPKGLTLLTTLRRAFRAMRDTAHFVRHPAVAFRARSDGPPGWPWTDQDVAILATRIDEVRPLLSSSRLAGRCRYVYRQGGSVIVHEDNDNNWWFCRTVDVHEFFAGRAPQDEFVLFTGHTDLPVDRTHRRYVKRSALKAWFAMNAMLDHPKVKARPFGFGALATPEDTATVRRIQERHLPKRHLFHCQFEVSRNPFERNYCLEQTGVPLGPHLPWPNYLEELASSYFCISPNGIGIDCVRTWEALLVRTVPVVRRSLVTEHHPDYPMIVLDDWSEFRSIEFSPELYERTWNDWDPDELLLDRYLARVERILGGMTEHHSAT
jgi:hypothetical protein